MRAPGYQFRELNLSTERQLAYRVRNMLTSFTNNLFHCLWSHHTHTTTTQRIFINFRKSGWKILKDDIRLKLKQQNMPTKVYNAEKILGKAIVAAAGSKIPHGGIKTVVANFPTKAVKLSGRRDENQRKHPRDAKLTQINRAINNLVQIQKRKHGSTLYNHLLTDVTAPNTGAQYRTIVKWR